MHSSVTRTLPVRKIHEWLQRGVSPAWPGPPIIAHWGAPDPALAEGSDEEIYQQFRKVAFLLQRRIVLCCAHPFDNLTVKSRKCDSRL